MCSEAFFHVLEGYQLLAFSSPLPHLILLSANQPQFIQSVLRAHILWERVLWQQLGEAPLPLPTQTTNLLLRLSLSVYRI